MIHFLNLDSLTLTKFEASLADVVDRYEVARNHGGHSQAAAMQLLHDLLVRHRFVVLRGGFTYAADGRGDLFRWRRDFGERKYRPSRRSANNQKTDP